MSAADSRLRCWCGNQELLPFSPDYCICTQCQTLVLFKPVVNNLQDALAEQSLYGKSYWFEHQQKDLGLSDILSRSRSDLPERIIYWMRTFLKYKTPPRRTLEIGCSHGGFVGMLQWAGFQSMGLELNPWVVDFAHHTFQIPMLLGKIEEQQSIEPGTLDAVILMDVLEHLPDPMATIQSAKKLLKPDGILFIQTPCYPENRTYNSMVSENHPFLMMLRSPEHVYLFNQSSVRQLLKQCGLIEVNFEQAIFSQYDMFLVASASPLTIHEQSVIDESLLATSGGRLVLALMDKDAECKVLNDNLNKSEADRAARLQQIQQLSAWLEEAETDRAARWQQIQQYSTWLKESEANRAAQLQVIKSQEKVISSISATLTRLKSSFLYKIGKRFRIWK